MTTTTPMSEEQAGQSTNADVGGELLIAVGQVRNERHILPLCVANLLHQGAGVVLVADHGSTDGTAEWLAEAAAADPRVQWLRNTDPGFHQADATTALTRMAVAAGATWVLPFDADEFWIAADESRSLRDVLAAHTSVAAFEVTTETFPAPADLDLFRPAALTRFSHRFADTATAASNEVDLTSFAKGLHSYLPHASQNKLIARATPDLDVAAGAHSITGLRPGVTEFTSAVRLLHMPLRDRRQLTEKRKHGERLRASGFPAGHGWQAQMLLHPFSDDAWDHLWRANTLAEEGLLSSSVTCDQLVEDDVLVRLASRLAGPPPPVRTSPPRIVEEHSLRVTQALVGNQRRLVGEQERLTAENHALQTETRRLLQRTEAQTARAGHLIGQLARRTAELESLRSSRSWRWTRPLRRQAGTEPAPDATTATTGSDTSWAESIVARDWYLAAYPDVAASGLDPAAHYALAGLDEGRLPRPPLEDSS